MTDHLIPWLISIFGVILSALLGMATRRLVEINAHLEQLNDRVYQHITKPGIHESAVSRLDERIAALLQVSQALHARIDRIDEARS